MGCLAGHLLQQGLTPFAVLATAFQKANGQVVVSLRSRTGAALAVAEKLKGGGHANAAGATLPRSVSSIPDAINYLRQALTPGAGLPVGTGTGLNSLDQLLSASPHS